MHAEGSRVSLIERKQSISVNEVLVLVCFVILEAATDHLVEFFQNFKRVVPHFRPSELQGTEVLKISIL